MLYENDELKHYGVLGMKWGIRKAAKTGGTYQYKSLSTKKWEKRSVKQARKADEFDRMGDSVKATKSRIKSERSSKIAARSAKHDSRMEAYARKAKTGHVVAANLLGGLWANKTYASIQASGYRKPTAVVTSILNSYVGLGPISAVVVKSAYIRDIDSDD